jgi:hypothetical protein
MASSKRKMFLVDLLSLLFESGNKSSDTCNEVKEDNFVESEGEDYMPQSDFEGEECDGYEVVLSIFRHAKSAIISDGSGLNGFMCSNNVVDCNGEFSDRLQVGDTDREDTQLSEGLLKCSKPNEGQLGKRRGK